MQAFFELLPDPLYKQGGNLVVWLVPCWTLLITTLILIYFSSLIFCYDMQVTGTALEMFPLSK